MVLDLFVCAIVLCEFSSLPTISNLCKLLPPSSTVFHAVVISWVCFHSPVLQMNSRVVVVVVVVVVVELRITEKFRGEIKEYIAYG